MHEPLLIVEVDSAKGASGTIEVLNARAADGHGTPTRLYCVGSLAGDGVIRLVDWGYATAAEARAAWPDARHTSEFMTPSFGEGRGGTAS